MAISFPDTVSSAVPFSDAAARTDAASSAKSQAISAGIEFSAGLERKSENSNDDDFESMLAFMMGGVVPAVQLPIVAESPDKIVASNSAETQDGETIVSFGVGATPTGTALSSGMTSATDSGTSPNSAKETSDLLSETSAERDKTESSTMTAVAADPQQEVVQTSSRRQTSDEVEVTVRTQPESIRSEPSMDAGSRLMSTETALVFPSGSNFEEISGLQTTGFSDSLTTDSNLSAAPEALSQAAIDALEQVGRLSRTTISQPLAIVPLESSPMISVPQDFSGPIITSSDSVSRADEMTMPTTHARKVSVAASQLSTLSEPSLRETSLPVAIESHPAEPDTQQQFATPQAAVSAAATIPKLTRPDSTVTNNMMPAISLSASILSVTPLQTAEEPVSSSLLTTLPVPATQGLATSEPVEAMLIPETTAKAGSRIASLAVASEHSLTSKALESIPSSDPSTAANSNELLVAPRRGPSLSAKPLPVHAEQSFATSGEQRLAVAAASEIVRSDMVQPNAAHPMLDRAASLSSEMRQPLSNQVSQAIMTHMERNGARSNDTLSVRLDPPELGEMTIEMSKTPEGLAVRVTAREAVTMDMLFARGQEIESHLRGQQMNLKSLEFLRADMSGNQFSQGQEQRDASRRSEELMNQARRGSRSFNSVGTSVGRIATPDSTYGLSFRA